MSSNADSGGGDTVARQPTRDPYAMKGKGQSAVGELRGRLAGSRTPGVVGAIERASLRSQITKLSEYGGGARPVQIKSDSGKTITVGVVKDGQYTGRAEYRDIALADRGSDAITTTPLAAMEFSAEPASERADEPEVQPPAPEDIPAGFEYDAATGDLVETATGRRRRSKRSGAAGTLIEGGGALYD